jgi:hypothetical protein
VAHAVGLAHVSRLLLCRNVAQSQLLPVVAHLLPPLIRHRHRITRSAELSHILLVALIVRARLRRNGGLTATSERIDAAIDCGNVTHVAALLPAHAAAVHAALLPALGLLPPRIARCMD